MTPTGSAGGLSAVLIVPQASAVTCTVWPPVTALFNRTSARDPSARAEPIVVPALFRTVTVESGESPSTTTSAAQPTNGASTIGGGSEGNTACTTAPSSLGSLVSAPRVCVALTTAPAGSTIPPGSENRWSLQSARPSEIVVPPTMMSTVLPVSWC